uniref:Uncharacterized protein n=1 Tax=Tanacetum cinerariifolium TaxID=118510 RepID=A0A699I0G8_TANCI|nr:hypothetical protein [Tanacetum cinerariifolium]
MSKRGRSGKSIRRQSSSSQETTIKERVRNLGAFDNETHQMNYDVLVNHPIHSTTVIDWSLLTDNGLTGDFFAIIYSGPFSKPQWANLFGSTSLCIESWFVSYSPPSNVATTYRSNPQLDGNEIGMAFTLRTAMTVRDERKILEFWSTIGDGEFVVGRPTARSIWNPKVRFAHRCITTTISGRKESTQRVTMRDLFSIYYIYEDSLEVL